MKKLYKKNKADPGIEFTISDHFPIETKQHLEKINDEEFRKKGYSAKKVKDGLHKIGEIAVDSGQIALADPCNFNNGPAITVSTNFGDGMFPVFEDWENNKRIALVIPLETEFHTILKEEINNNKEKPIWQPI